MSCNECFLCFSVILILVSQRAEVQLVLLFGTEKMKLEMHEAMKRQRGNPPTLLEWLVVIYVLGYIWEETQEMFGEGIRNYLRNMWNFIDFSRNSLYGLVFVLRGIAYIQQTTQIKQDPRTAFIPREHWDDFDPQLIVRFAPEQQSKFIYEKKENSQISFRLFFAYPPVSFFRLKVSSRLPIYSQHSNSYICFR